MGIRFKTGSTVGPKSRRTNLSRKKIIGVMKEKKVAKIQRRNVRVEERAKSAAEREAHNPMAKKSHEIAVKMHVAKQSSHLRKKSSGSEGIRTFDHGELHTVSDGLTASIRALGETPSPLSMFACAMTALSAPTCPRNQIPYLMVILGATMGKISQQVLKAKLPSVVRLMSSMVNENMNEPLIVMKATKAVESALVCVKDPMSCNVLNYLKALEPSKANTRMMPDFLQLVRKYIQQCCLTGRKDFYFYAFPYLTSLCGACITEASPVVANAARTEFIALIHRTVSPAIVESSEGQLILSQVMENDLVPLFKPYTKHNWSMAADMVEALFSRICYLKRSPSAEKFLLWFPKTTFILRILDKIRQLDDITLNSHLEKAIVAIGRCIQCKTFLECIPFDPRQGSNGLVINSDEDFWKRSYIVNILRRTCMHDSLPYFTDRILPIMKYCEVASQEAELVYRSHWSAFAAQYWKVLNSFCQYPLEVTEPSAKVVAQTIVVQLSKVFVDSAATALHTLCRCFHHLATTEESDFKKVTREEGDDTQGNVAESFNGDGCLDNDVDRDNEDAYVKIDLFDDLEYLAHHDKDWDPHTFHGISKARAEEVCQILSTFSKNIMPRLCNTFETHDSTAVLDSIQSYSLVCSPDVLQSILQSILQVGGDITESIATTSSLPMEGAGDTSIMSKRRVILDITSVLVKQLPTESIIIIYDKIVEPVLKMSNMEHRLLQKKAYKLLYAIFEHRLKDMLHVVPRMIDLLASGQQNVTVSSLKMRVKCLSWAIDVYKMYNPDHIKEFIQGTVGEVILFSREHSSGARAMAMEVLEKMGRYLESSGEGSGALLHMVLAGLSGKTGMLVASTIVAMAKVVSFSAERLSQKDITGAVGVVSRLLTHSSTEVRNSSALFLRMMFKLAKKCDKASAALESALPRILEGVAVVTSQPICPSAARTTMRVILEKCIKKFSFDRVEAFFPVGSHRFLLYANRMLKKEERKEKREINAAANQAERNYFEEMFMGGIKVATGAGAEERHGNDENGTQEYDNEDEGTTTDLLQDGALNNFVAHRPAAHRHKEHDLDNEDPNDRMTLVMEGDKIRILPKDVREKELAIERRQLLADKLMKKGASIAANRLNVDALGGKRGRDEVQDFENEELLLRHGKVSDMEFVANQMKDKGINPSSAAHEKKVSAFIQEKEELRAAKKARFEKDIRKGDEFKARGNALGDVKKGGVDPYAYVPLDRRFMNKRHRQHAVKRLESVLHKGNSKGFKADRKTK
eukprot:Tbor_TRINITY_DN2749_c0_g1::TRINITY_DN2749_c0_g1_i1::g.15213::m.15213/K14794/RRP12; ribosomal RNA-processing protein 12